MAGSHSTRLSIMSELEQYHGSLVAFEGATDMLWTQLRLLPTSPQICILPPLDEYLDDCDDDAPFNIKDYIKRLHDAAISRYLVARAFLRDATPNSKRLVFMNGGTPTAYAACIKAIVDNETHGDIALAEQTLKRLLQNGLAGLEHTFMDSSDDLSQQWEDALEEHPDAKAMRAADALDRLTANLQPSTDVDLCMSARPRSMSLPMYKYDDRFGDAAPFFVFGTQHITHLSLDEDANKESGLARSFYLPATQDRQSANEPTGDPHLQVTSRDMLDQNATTTAPASAYDGDEGDDVPTRPRPSRQHSLQSGMRSPQYDAYSIHTTEPVVFGRASVVQMRSPGHSRTAHRRSRSLDPAYVRSSMANTQCRPSLTCLDDLDLNSQVQVDGFRHEDHVWLTLNAADQDAPRSVFLRTKQPTIILSPPPAPEARKRRGPSMYVDKGTDTVGLDAPEVTYQPILPFVEDLVVHFKGTDVDLILDSVVQAFRTGMYPVQASYSTSEASVADDDMAAPSTPTSPHAAHLADSDVKVQGHHNPPPLADGEEYDPFAYDRSSVPPSKTMEAIHIAHVMKVPVPPPPPVTIPPPPASVYEMDDKFCDCDTTGCKTAVATQNDLRIILNGYFPPEDQGYHHFHFTVLPEMGGLWKPVFNDYDQQNKGDVPRRIDQILAVGAQKGINKTFLSGVTGQLEQLGVKSGEVSRSGRLDFRYLVANAMQAFTAQPLAAQAQENPFTNSYLLATLIIPFLETYFAVHPDVRLLLLEYPPDHLPTVLALQKLIGLDLMTVAQVVDPDAQEPLQFTHVRGQSISQSPEQHSRSGSSSSLALSSTSKSSSSLHKRSAAAAAQENVPISRANFLLTSSATESEIDTFVSTIRKLLVQASSFYHVPLDTIKPKSASKRVPSPLSSIYSAFPKVRPQSPPLSPSPRSPPAASAMNRALSPEPASASKSEPRSSMQHSRSRRIKTIRTPEKALELMNKSPQGVAENDGGADADVDAADDSDESSDYDMEERRLMPIFFEKPVVRKGNSRKALKFLGLA